VSNTESDTNATKKRTENPSVRRSSRISHPHDGDPAAQDLNTGCDDTEKQPDPVARRQSLRSSKGLPPNKALTNPFAEPKPRATRKRAHVGTTDSKPASGVQTMKYAGPLVEPEAQAKRARSNSTCSSKNIANSGSHPKTHVPLVGDKHCEDILTTDDHRLVRIPFSTRQYVSGIGIYDLGHRDNPLQVPSYVTDIFQRLYHAEVSLRCLSTLFAN
jgi:hypothetical protein